MFSLLLAIIISASLCRSSVADPGLQSSLGFDTNVAEYQQTYASPSYGSGSRYYGSQMYTPEYPYFGNQQGFRANPQDVYLPGRVNPFSYPYRRPRSSSYVPGFTNVNFPQFSLYENYETPMNPTSTYSGRDQVFPYYDTYSVYNTRKSAPTSNITFIRSPKSVNNNGTFDLSSLGNTKRILPALSVKRERDLQMTYLGFLPSLVLRTDPQEENKRSSNGSNQNVFQFFPLRVGGDSKRSVSPSPILVSPYRIGDDKLRQSFSKYQQSSFNPITPLVPTDSRNPAIAHNSMMGFGSRPYSNSYVHPTSETHFSASSTQFSSGVSAPIVSPFHSRTPFNMLGSPLTPSLSRYLRTPDERTQNGYYLFDVQPIKGYNYDDYTTSKSDQPYSRAMQSNKLTSAAGYNQQEYKSAEYPQEMYYSGRASYLPQSRTFSNIDFGRLLPNYQGWPNRIQNSYNPGRQLIVRPLGPTGLSR